MDQGSIRYYFISNDNKGNKVKRIDYMDNKYSLHPSYSTIFPSFMYNTRSLNLANSSLWVTIRKVWLKLSRRSKNN